MTQTKSIQAESDLEVNMTSFRRHVDAGNLSPMTRRTYLEAVLRLEAFLRAAGMPQRLASIRREHVEAFIADQLDRWKPATAANRYGGLRSFFKWAVDEGEITQSPMAKMRPPKVGEPQIPILTQQEIERLLAACKGQDFEARRDLAILRIMATCGLRRAEITFLRYVPDDPERNDIDLDIGQARVLGKGGRERIVGLDPRTVKALDRYLRLRARHSAAHTNSLWVGKRGPFTADGIRQMLERRVRQAGITKHVHPHMLRHSFAHYWQADGGSETDLMRLAGWRSRQMLSRYAASAGQERAVAASRRVGLGSRI